MTPPSKKLLLTLEQSVPTTAVIPFNLTTVGGFIDSTAVTVNESDAGRSFEQISSHLRWLTVTWQGLSWAT